MGIFDNDYEGSFPVKVTSAPNLVFADDKVDVSGSDVNIADGGNSITVDASDLDIRNLVFADDKVDVSGSDVNIADGGNSITVDASDLDIRNLVFADDKVDVSGSDVNIADGGNSITVDASDLDIRNLVFADDKVDVSGSTIAIGLATGQARVHQYYTDTVTQQATKDFDYLITNTKKFRGTKLLVSGRGSLRVEFGTWDGTTFVVHYGWFQSVQSQPQIDISGFESGIGDGVTKKMRVRVANDEGSNSLTYVTLDGIES